MPKRVPVQTVVLFRNGKQVTPEIGKPFDFTDEELKEIMSLNKNAVTKIITTDLSEDDAADAEVANDKLKKELEAGAAAKKTEKKSGSSEEAL